MNRAATHVVASIPEIVVAYGVSDEYSFVFHRTADLFERRAAKLVSTVVSLFTAAYVALWPVVFGSGEVGGQLRSLNEENFGQRSPNKEDSSQTSPKQTGSSPSSAVPLSLAMLPTFDGRAVCYPSWENLRDYLSWRQVDCTFAVAVAFCRCLLLLLLLLLSAVARLVRMPCPLLLRLPPSTESSFTLVFPLGCSSFPVSRPHTISLTLWLSSCMRSTCSSQIPVPTSSRPSPSG